MGCIDLPNKILEDIIIKQDYLFPLSCCRLTVISDFRQDEHAWAPCAHFTLLKNNSFIWLHIISFAESLMNTLYMPNMILKILMYYSILWCFFFYSIWFFVIGCVLIATTLLHFTFNVLIFIQFIVVLALQLTILSGSGWLGWLVDSFTLTDFVPFYICTPFF